MTKYIKYALLHILSTPFVKIIISIILIVFIAHYTLESLAKEDGKRLGR